MIVRPNALLLAAAIFLILLGRCATAAPPMLNSLVVPTANAAAESAAPVADRRAEIAELARLAQQKLEVDPTNAAAADVVARFKSAETVFAQQDAVAQQTKDLEARQLDLHEQLQALPTEHEPGSSISFVEFDRLVNELAAEQSRTELVAAKVKAAKSALEAAQTEFDKCETARRQSQEAADVGKDGPDAAALIAAAEQAKLASGLAADLVALRQKELTREKLAAVVQGLTVELLDKKAARSRPMVVFSESDLQDQLKKLETQEVSLRAALRKAETNLPIMQSKFASAKTRHDAATDDREVLAEELEAWRRGKEKSQDEINTYLAQLLEVDQLRTAWNRLHQLLSVANQPSAEALQTWETETSVALKALIGSTQGHLFRIDELRNQLATIDGKVDVVKDGPAELRRWIEKQRDSLEEMIRVHEANLVTIGASRRLHGKLRTEISNGTDLLSVRQWARDLWRRAQSVWGFEVFTTEVNGVPRSITVDRIVRVVALFIFGLVLSRIFSAFLANRLLKRFRLSKDATVVIRTLTFYLLVVAVALAALHKMNVPLTAFTILGGALAIGVGFGSQALINNFISGLIMLAERPVRIGERIVFDKFDGVVEGVGFRCMKLRTGTDHLVTIPNSSLINESIENIGRRRTIQRTLNLAITYDTPRERIAEAVAAIRDVLEEPGVREPIHPVIGWDKHPPRVHFNDFNAESLNIQVVYHYAPPDQAGFNEHAQQVNFRICEEFERLGVAFAFPSRTVYLADTGKRGLAAHLSSNDAA